MTYIRPTDLPSALAAATQPGGLIVSGGTDVYPAVQHGISPAFHLDLTAIPTLSGIDHTPQGTRIGAATTWTQIITANLPPAFDALKQAARQVGSIQIQNAGTIAGNLCNASPAADGVPPLLCLNASVELQSAARGTRTLPLSDFLQGVRKTALAEDELLTAIVIPSQPANMRSAFHKLGSRSYLVISISMVAALIQTNTAGHITEARIAVGACSPTAQRLTSLEQDCIGQRPENITVEAHHLTPLSPIDDVRGTAAYRLDAVRAQIQRALMQAAAQ